MTTFIAGMTYTRADVLSTLGYDDPGGGPWYTGLVSDGDDHYIFCGIGVGGRTGHDYKNYFDGVELVWHGRTGSRLNQPSIRALLDGTGFVHIFFRDDNRAPFTYAGIGRVVSTKDVTPVEIRWSFLDDPGPHPEYLPNEVTSEAGVIEGAKRSVTINAYERDPAARARCIRRWGYLCVVCGFDFYRFYGELGRGFIHVHHLRSLSEIGTEYVLDPEMDLRPVCPNCHAMLHRTKPALSIEALQAHMKKTAAKRI